jgi:hypothetical protein
MPDFDVTFIYEEGERLIEIDQSQIDAETSIPTLISWRDALERKYSDMKAQLEARRLAGTDEISWIYSVSNALAFTRIGLQRVKKRLAALGVKPERDLEFDKLRELYAGNKVDAAFGRALKTLVQTLPNGPKIIEDAKLLMIETDREQKLARKREREDN